MKNSVKIISLLALGLLSACALEPAPNQLSSVSQAVVQQFAAEGKAALRYPRCDEYRGCKEEAFSANLHWLHKSSSDELSLYDPAGQEALKIFYQGELVQLRDNKGEKMLSRAELAQTLGVPIPVEKLPAWLLQQRDNPKFSEDGWQIEAEQWQGQYYRRLTLRQEDYYLRIIIQHLVPF